MKSLGLLACSVICVVAACGDTEMTGVRLEVQAAPGLELDRFRIKLAERVGIVAADDTVSLLAPTDLNGETVEIEVWGIAGTVQLAYGVTSVRISANEMKRATVQLEGLDCADTCTPDAVRCSGDGITTCEPTGAGCFAWSAAQACPSGTPFCSNGQCADTCVDECETGENACAGSLADKTCGDFDSDSCLEWSTPVACGAGETCNGTECATDGCDVTGCEAAPANTCIDTWRIEVYEDGSCELDGSCSYASTERECESHCEGGKCMCACGRAAECCRKVAMQTGDDPMICELWNIRCASERPGDTTTAEAQAMVALYCPEFTCF